MKEETLDIEKVIKLEEAAQGVFAIPSKNKMSDEVTKKMIEELKKKKNAYTN
ncbi:hypothetical protein P9265_18875 [Schinkia azotoformans]|uniref:hypothetical protein n=1 Tax=Schinkia azotoformans TaxID=1454 RepID=UPI002E229470|nr:hypothetical protein [Schinkia azotoformans]